MNSRTITVIFGLGLGILATSCRLDPLPLPFEDDAGCACSVEPNAGMPNSDTGDGGPDDAGCDGPCPPPPYPNGTLCTSAADCASGFCVDRVCCDSACTGVCRSCRAYAKGSGSDGTCGVIKPGTDPNRECVGVCNEQGVCIAGPQGAYCEKASECASGFCVDGVCCAASACSPIDSCHIAICGAGTGTCTDIPRACPGGGTCANDLCPGQCTGALGLPAERLISGPGDMGEMRRVTIGDIDNDGDTDVLATYAVSYNDTMSWHFGILRNQGAGTFGSWEKQYAMFGGFLLLADMNNDGWLDTVHGAYNEPQILIQLNDGTGLITMPVDVSFSPTISEPMRKLVTADLNNDGYPDFVVSGMNSGQLFTSISASGASFGTPIDVGAKLTESGDFEAADINADGQADLVFTSNSTDTIHVRLGIGNGSFGSVTSYPTVAMVNSLELRDVNADGKLDLIASNGTDTAVRLNLGNGSLGAGTTYSGGSADLADLNGDGSIDIMGATTLFNNGSGSFVPQTMDYMPHENAAAGDINGDGLTDLVRMTENKSFVAILRNQGNGAFPRQYVPFDITVKHRDYSVFVDLNGDNLVDLATLDNAGSQVGVHMNLGHGAFAPSVNYCTCVPENSYGAIEAADMNGDGQMDLVASDGTAVLVYLNNGGGVLAPVVQYPGGTEYGSFLNIGDFNADGYPDVAGVNNGLEVMLNQGNGTLAPGVRFATVPGPITDLVTADLNNDGYSDFVAHGTSENVSIFMNNTLGAAVFQPQPIEAFGWLINGIAVGDVNGDNYADIVFSSPSIVNDSGGQTSLNDGHGVFRAGPAAPYGVTDIVDVDGNGRVDFIITADSFLCISLRGGIAKAGCYDTFGGPGDVVDIDGDGIPEIITPQGALHKITCTP